MKLTLRALALLALLSFARLTYAQTYQVVGTETSTLAAGLYYDGQNTPGFKLINHLAEVAPDAPSPIPDFAGLSNHRAWVAVMSAPPVGPTSPRPGYYFLAGSVEEDRLFYADEALVHANIAQF